MVSRCAPGLQRACRPPSAPSVAPIFRSGAWRAGGGPASRAAANTLLALQHSLPPQAPGPPPLAHQSCPLQLSAQPGWPGLWRSPSPSLTAPLFPPPRSPCSTLFPSIGSSLELGSRPPAPAQLPALMRASHTVRRASPVLPQGFERAPRHRPRRDRRPNTRLTARSWPSLPALRAAAARPACRLALRPNGSNALPPSPQPSQLVLLACLALAGAAAAVDDPLCVKAAGGTAAGKLVAADDLPYSVEYTSTADTATTTFHVKVGAGGGAAAGRGSCRCRCLRRKGSPDVVPEMCGRRMLAGTRTHAPSQPCPLPAGLLHRLHRRQRHLPAAQGVPPALQRQGAGGAQPVHQVGKPAGRGAGRLLRPRLVAQGRRAAEPGGFQARGGAQLGAVRRQLPPAACCR